ncbi:MAG: TonB-dependent receptor [Kordiimonadaceae bacterium]|nr:TonB-dependent receptor [Kordiimonadaceae bacterium]
MNISFKSQLLSGSALVAAFLGGISSHAQGAETEALEEIIVTASLRAKNVQDVPITVSVLGAAQIEKADIHDATSIAMNTPGLAYGEFSPGQAIFSMRGVGSADDGAGLDNSVALFLDGVYIGRGAGVNFDAFDLERIEVLKGPQGALFGRNTIGGAISVVTQKPSDDFSAKVAATVGNEGIFRIQGLINGSVTDNLAAKIVVNHRQHSGYVRNTLLNKDVNDEDTTSARGQFLLSLDNSDWLLSADYMEDHREEAGRFPFVNGNFDYITVAQSLGSNRPQTSSSPLDGFADREAKGISLQGDITFDTGKLTTITAFRNVQTDWEMPSIGAPAGGGFDLANGVFGVDVNDHVTEDIDTFSQELRWTSELDGDFGFVGGLYFFKEKTDRPEEFRLDQNSEAAGQIVVGNEYTRTQNETTSYAVYGQAQWDFSEKWSAIAGARFTHDKKEYIATAVNCGQPEEVRAAAGFPNFSACAGVGGSLAIVAETFRVPAGDTWSDFSPMATLQYRPNDDLMIFVTVATGFKSGGFAGSQGVAAAAADSVEPENAINYELGFKSVLFDQKLRLNATAFYMDYTDLQIVRFGPVPSSPFGTFLTTNIGSAKITGVELEFDMQVSEQFSISGNYAYLDTEVKDLVINGADLSGKTLRQAPEHSFNISADYYVPIANDMGGLDFNLQYSFTDEQRFDYLSDDTISEAMKLLSARIAWTSSDGGYGLALWGKNLTDYSYVNHTYIIGPGVIGTWGAPRTFGITGIVKF